MSENTKITGPKKMYRIVHLIRGAFFHEIRDVFTKRVFAYPIAVDGQPKGISLYARKESGWWKVCETTSGGLVGGPYRTLNEAMIDATANFKKAGKRKTMEKLVAMQKENEVLLKRFEHLRGLSPDELKKVRMKFPDEVKA
jgi:hypothetical protein